jgi:DNA modification methylase
VIDPFAGSGSTLIAAEQMGRNSIGIEIDPKYCKVIKERMDNLQQTIFNMTGGVTVWR